MGSKLYVGNLSYNTTSSDLEQLFSQHGTVQSAEGRRGRAQTCTTHRPLSDPALVVISLPNVSG